MLIRYGGGGLVAKLCLMLATPWTLAYQAPLFVEFSRRECWSGLPFLSPGNRPNLGIKPGSPVLLADSLPTELPGKLKKGDTVAAWVWTIPWRREWLPWGSLG